MSTGSFPRTAEVDWRRDFAEEVSGLVLVDGTPRAAMRVLGWMVVCQPREQDAAAIQDELELSAGSVSVAVRTLCTLGMLERVEHPGDRRIYYRLRGHGWEEMLELHFQVLGEMRRLAHGAINAAPLDVDERLVEMRDTSALMEEGVASLLWQSRRHGSARPVADTTSLTADA